MSGDLIDEIFLARIRDKAAKNLRAISAFGEKESLKIVLHPAFVLALLDRLDSAKGSLEILARALRDIIEIEEICATPAGKSVLQEDCERAIAEVKARGDWCL